jgi:hypothetical protein
MAADVVRALYGHFGARWAVLTEVSAPPVAPDVRWRRIDALLLRAARSAGTSGIERLAVEVKVSRADFLADVRAPEKQAPWRALSHRHAYAVPADLVDPAEVPEDSGLLIVEARPASWNPHLMHVEWAKRAKRPAGHVPDDLPLPVLMGMFSRTSHAEARLKGYAGTRPEERDADDLRAEVRRLQHELGLASGRHRHEIEARKQWQQAFGAVGAPPCSTCGRPLRPKLGRFSGFRWHHAVSAEADACSALRREAERLADEQRPEGQRRGSYYVPDPEPVDIIDMVSLTTGS